MPLYEYVCQSCGNRFEVLQRIGAGAEGLTCPECGVETVAKQFSTFASGSAAGTGGASASGSACGGGGGFT